MNLLTAGKLGILPMECLCQRQTGSADMTTATHSLFYFTPDQAISGLIGIEIYIILI